MLGCRDCDICTRTSMQGCLYKWGRALLAICTLFISEVVIWLMNSGKRKCPTCGHSLNAHQRDKEGRFVD